MFTPHNKLEISGDLSNMFMSLLLPNNPKNGMPNPQIMIDNYVQDN